MLMSIQTTLSCSLGSSHTRGSLAYHALGRVSANSATRLVRIIAQETSHMYCLLTTLNSPVTFDGLHAYLTVEEVNLHEIKSNSLSLANQSKRSSTDNTWNRHANALGLPCMYVAIIHE